MSNYSRKCFKLYETQNDDCCNVNCSSFIRLICFLVSEWDSKRKLAVKRKYKKMLQKDDSTQSYQTISNLYKEEEGGSNGPLPPPPKR